MYCPECKCEYLEGFTRCADCDVPLVERLPEENEPSQHIHPTPTDQKEDLVLLKRFPTTHEAQLARGFLVSNGIEAAVSGEDWLGIRRDRIQRGGVKLFVRKEEQKEAEDLFKKSGITTEIDEQQHLHHQNQYHQRDNHRDDYRDREEREYRYGDSANKRGKAVAFTKFLLIVIILIFIILIINQFFLQ